MDKFWQIAVSVCGFGAVGAFVFWSLYKKWLSLPIFRKLTSAQTFIVMLAFLGLTFASLIAILVVYVQSSTQKGGLSVTNNQGIVTQGQIGNNTVLNQRPDRIIDDEMKNQLLSFIPKNKNVKIMVLNGDPERDKFADQIDNFLTSQGYKIVSPHLSFLALSGAPTPTGTHIYPDDKDANIMVIQIGVNNRSSEGKVDKR